MAVDDLLKLALGGLVSAALGMVLIIFNIIRGQIRKLETKVDDLAGEMIRAKTILELIARRKDYQAARREEDS